MTETRASYTVSIDRDASGLPTRLAYSLSTPVYPAIGVISNCPAPCASCGETVQQDTDHADLEQCSACGLRRMRPSVQPAAAASRDISLIAYVDDLLDLLQDVGGMSAEWCATRLQTFEALLKLENLNGPGD